MENVMASGFCELNEKEMMMVDGGWDSARWIKGCGQVIFGGAACAISAIAAVSYPMSSSVAADGFACGAVMYTTGISNIYHSF